MSARSRRFLFAALVLVLVALMALLRHEPSPSPVVEGQPEARTPEPTGSPPPTLEAVVPPEPSLAPTPVPEPVPTPSPPAPADSPPTPAPSRFPVVRGSISFDDGTPLPGAVLVFWTGAGSARLGSAIADALGSFVVTLPAEGFYEVLVAWQGLSARLHHDARDGFRIVLSTTRLRGRVSPSVAGATVRLLAGFGYPRHAVGDVEGPVTPTLPALDASAQPVDGLTVTTDANGRFEASVLRPIRLRLHASAPGWTSKVVKVDDRSVGAEVVVELARAVDVPIVVRDQAGPVDGVVLRARGRDLPSATTEIRDGHGSFLGIPEGAECFVSVEAEPWGVLRRDESLRARASPPVEIELRRLEPTEVVVVDPRGAPIPRASVTLSYPVHHPHAASSAWGGRRMGHTDAEGRFRCFFSADAADGEVRAPPGEFTGRWTGKVAPGQSHRVLIESRAHTRLRVRPTDCIAYVLGASDLGLWTFPGDVPLDVAEDATVEFHSQGKYAFRRVKARQLPPGEAEVVLEPAVACTFVVPEQVTKVWIQPNYAEGTFQRRVGPTEIEVRGLLDGLELTVYGAIVDESHAHTERVKFVAKPGLRIVLSAAPPKEMYRREPQGQ